ATSVGLGDVTVDAKQYTWKTAAGTACDPATHTYVVTVTPDKTGAVSFGPADLLLTDNVGTVTLTVEPVV
ncbi:MAG: hypothetical protein ACXV3V_11540, partial [Actinomycetes bacterium]